MLAMQDTLSFPTLGSPPTSRELSSFYRSDLSISAPSCSSPFVSAPSSPRSLQGFYFSAPTSPTWATFMQTMEGCSQAKVCQRGTWDDEAGSVLGDGACDTMATWAQEAVQVNEGGSPMRGKSSPETEDRTRKGYAVREHVGTGDALTEYPPIGHGHARTEYHGAEYDRAEQTPTGDSGTGRAALGHSHARTELSGAEYYREECTRSGDAETEHTIARTEHFPLARTEYSGAAYARTEHSPTRDAKGEHTRTRDAETEHTPLGDTLKEHMKPGDDKAELSPTEHSGIEHGRTRYRRTSHSDTLLPPLITDTHTLKRLHLGAAHDEVDASYSRNSFYASAVPFAWEEKAGTARSAATHEATNGEEDSNSLLLSSSSEFEFSSSRFSELLDEPPMSPTPITPSFRYHACTWSPGSEVAQKSDNFEASQNNQTCPLRLPLCLENPVLSVRQLLRDDAHEESKRSYRSVSSISVPQSPRSPHKFDLKAVLCGVFAPTNSGFDPFVAAMEKVTASIQNGDVNKKNTIKMPHKHHRRTQSSSPLQVFPSWDDLPANSNPSSNGLSCKEEVKDMHPIQNEIKARTDSCGTPKGSKRWSFKGFLHGRSPSQQMLLQHSSLQSSHGSSGRDSSCSSSSMAEGGNMDSDADDNIKMRQCVKIVSSMTSTPSMPSSSSLSSSSSGDTRPGKMLASGHAAIKSPGALHHTNRKAYTEELRKKTFLRPHKQGLLGCLGLQSKSYKALTTLSKPLQSVST